MRSTFRSEEARYVRALALCMRLELNQLQECEKAGVECIELLREFPAINWASFLENYMQTCSWLCSPVKSQLVVACIVLAWEKLSLVRCSFGDYQGAAEAEEKLELTLKEQAGHTYKHSSVNKLSLEASSQFFNNNFEQAEMALLRSDPPQVRLAINWAEREPARDLIYGMKSRLLFRSENDTDDETTWRDVVSVCDTGGSKTVFLVYTRLDNDMIGYLLHSGEEPQWFTRNVLLLRETVHGLQTCMAEKDVSNRLDVHERTRETMQALYALLVQPWSPFLREMAAERIVIVPSEELSLVPFAALIDEDGAHLVERYAISYADCSCAVRNVKGNSETVIVLWWLEIRMEAYREARFVAEKLKATGLKRVKFLERPRATAEAILEAFPRCEWVHVASHAVVNEKFPYGGILMEELGEPLHGAKSLKERVTELLSQPSNVIITGRQVEVTDVQLRTLAVVLSACSTGLGEICSEGTLGLCRSLHSAGVTAVVVSLWDVNDEATMKLMKQFYTELSRGAPEEPLYTIRDWAAFTLSGSVSVRLTN